MRSEQHQRQSEKTHAHRFPGGPAGRTALTIEHPLWPDYRAALAVVGRGAAFFTYLFSQFNVSATTCRFDSRAA